VPLQLALIERAVRLWSNRGETVLSPFAGIGSEGYIAVREDRRYIGIELKPSYWQVACGNMRRVEEEKRAGTLFEHSATDHIGPSSDTPENTPQGQRCAPA
jgi:DNA modification methylase